MNGTCVYKDYHLAPMTSVNDDGSFRARVAVLVLAGNRTRSQRFVDFESYATLAEANERAIAGGRDWVDAQHSPADARPIRGSTTG